MDDFLGETELWGLALGVVSPLVISVVQQPGWSRSARWVVGWVCALIVGFLTVAARGDLDDGPTLVRTMLLTLIAAQAAYQGWKNGPAPAIERATSPKRHDPPFGA